MIFTDNQEEKKLRKINLLVSYRNMKQLLGKEIYTDKCNMNERTVLAWLQLGIWKLRGIMRGVQKGR
jgi:hypothetical protein